MDSDTAPTGLEHHLCWELLRDNEVGRLAVIVDGHPEIFPINYVVDHGTVVFRTAEGTKLTAALASGGVAFEVDGATDGDVWSVVLKGRAHEVTRLDESLNAAGLPIHPSQTGKKNHVIRIDPDTVSGRRFPRAAAEAWDTSWTSGTHAAPE